MAAPDLRVVQGDWEACSAWLDFPAQFVARAMDDQNNTVDFRVAKEDAVKAARQGRRSPVFEFWSVVCGSPPPVPGAPQHDNDLTSLLDAHACFQGMLRPIGSDEVGGNFVAYVLKPRFHYVFEASMGCLAKKEAVRHDVVFIAYARLDEPFSPAGHSAKGVLTHWHFVRADATDGNLPVDFAKRYDRRLW